MHLDCAVTGGVGNASQDESITHLVIIKESLFGLVNASGYDLSGACGAGTGTATVGKVDSGFLGGIYVVVEDYEKSEEHECAPKQ